MVSLTVERNRVLMTHYKLDRIDEILNMFEGGIHAKGSDRGGYPTYFDKPYPLWIEDRKKVAKQALLEAFEQSLPDKISEYDSEVPYNHLTGWNDYRNEAIKVIRGE